MGMEPMVDVVFQLLIFFLFSFHVRLLETLYPVEVISARPETRTLDQNPPVVVLEAGPDGDLSAIRLDAAPLDSLADLENALRKWPAGQEHADRRVFLRPATALKYEHVVAAALTIGRAGKQVQLASSGTGVSETLREASHEKP